MLISVWLYWGSIRALLPGGQGSHAHNPEQQQESTAKDSLAYRVAHANDPVPIPAGTWVGKAEITESYSKKLYGDTPGPHRHAALYVHLGIEDRYMDQYAGDGELFVAGEQYPRPLHLTLEMTSGLIGIANASCSVTVSSEARISMDLCQYDSDSTSMFNSDSGLLNKVVLHRGDAESYRNLLSKLQAEAQESASEPQPANTYKDDR